jgi:hypothetical protein
MIHIASRQILNLANASRSRLTSMGLGGCLLLALSATPGLARDPTLAAGRATISCTPLDASNKALPYGTPNTNCPQIMFWFDDCAALERVDPHLPTNYGHCFNREQLREVSWR